MSAVNFYFFIFLMHVSVLSTTTLFEEIATTSKIHFIYKHVQTCVLSLSLSLSFSLSLFLSLTVLYEISLHCFRFLFQYWSSELIRCSTALFTGCMLIMYN